MRVFYSYSYNTILWLRMRISESIHNTYTQTHKHTYTTAFGAQCVRYPKQTIAISLSLKSRIDGIPRRQLLSRSDCSVDCACALNIWFLQTLTTFTNLITFFFCFCRAYCSCTNWRKAGCQKSKQVSNNLMRDLFRIVINLDKYYEWFGNIM